MTNPLNRFQIIRRAKAEEFYSKRLADCELSAATSTLQTVITQNRVAAALWRHLLELLVDRRAAAVDDDDHVGEATGIDRNDGLPEERRPE